MEQKRAKHAWKTIQTVKQSADRIKEFGAQTKKLPVRILTSGLGPSLAFLAAKKYAPDLQSALNNWIADRDWAKSSTATSNPNASLIQRIIENDAEFLRLATNECMAYLQWLVRFAEAEGLVDNIS